MFKRSMLVLTLLAACIVSDECSVSVNYYARLVADLKEWYHTCCVFLVATQDLEMDYLLTRLRRTLSMFGVMSVNLALEDLRTIAPTYKCSQNRPLYVLFLGGRTMYFTQEMGRLESYPRWILILDSSKLTSREDILEDVNVPFDCELIMAEWLAPDKAELTEVYRVAEGLPLKQDRFGVWDAGTGLSAKTGCLYDRRNSLQGLELPAAAYNLRSTPTLKVSRHSNNTVTVDGYFGKVATTLAQRINLTLIITQYENITYGSMSDNGTWDGFVALVLNKETHLVLNDLTMNVDRRHAVDFLMPLVHSRVRLYIRKPNTLSFKWNSFLAPFTPVLWFGILACMLVISVMLAAVHGISRRHVDRQLATLSLADSFFYVLALFCLQGPSLSPVTKPSRTVLLLAGLTSVIIAAAYSAALTSFFTVQKSQMPFETIQGFIKDGSYKLGVVRNALRVYFSNPTGKLHQDLYSKFIIPNMHTSPTTAIQGLARICQEPKYAFLSEIGHTTDYLAKVPCEIVALPEHLMAGTESMIVGQDSPYKGIIDHNLHYMRDSGVLQHIQQQVWPEPLLREDDEFPSVAIHHVIPILVVLASGLALSALLTFLELGIVALVAILRYYHII